MKNPRFPAKCVVKREISDGGYPPQLTALRTILVSVCGFRNESLAEIGGGSIADYKIALPRYGVVVENGDLIEVKDARRTIKGKVKRDRVTNYGANIWFDEVK